MAVAVVVSLINQTVIQQYAAEDPGFRFEGNLNRYKARLKRAMREGGEQQVKHSLRNLPRGMRNHIFILDAHGNELLGREPVLKKLKQGRIMISAMPLKGADGQAYTLISAGRIPPRALLAPGPRGVGMRLAVAAVISALVSLLLARYLATPLAQLSRASRQLAAGDLSVRVGAPLDQRKDEFGQLALDMGEMAERLQASQHTNRRWLRDVKHEVR